MGSTRGSQNGSDSLGHSAQNGHCTHRRTAANNVDLRQENHHAVPKAAKGSSHDNVCHARDLILAHWWSLLLQCGRIGIREQGCQEAPGPVAGADVLDVQDWRCGTDRCEPIAVAAASVTTTASAGCVDLASEELLPSHVGAHHGSRPASCTRASASLVLHDEERVANRDELVCRIITTGF